MAEITSQRLVLIVTADNQPRGALIAESVEHEREILARLDLQVEDVPLPVTSKDTRNG